MPKMEAALYRWFLKLRDRHVPVSGIMMKTKAKKLHAIFKETNSFNASDGWINNFKARFGVRLLAISGEKLSSNKDAVLPFKQKLKKTMADFGISRQQLYNADESGLFWRMIPSKTFVHSGERSAPGRKIAKDRFTFLVCTNSTGEHKLKLLTIGKAKNPRCFKNFRPPMTYTNSKTAWMTKEIFKNWFHSEFVPQVLVMI